MNSVILANGVKKLIDGFPEERKSARFSESLFACRVQPPQELCKSMSDDVTNAIERSRATLVMRDPARPLVWDRLPLPDDARNFFERVAGGTLLPITLNDGISFGFEIEPDALTVSINAHFGIPSGDPTFGYCDKCFMFAHASADPEMAWAIDLNQSSFGRIFACRMALGEHPQHGAVVVASSLSEWLRFWMNNLGKAHGNWRELDKEPQLALLT